MKAIIAILFSVVLSASAQIPPNVMQELLGVSSIKTVASPETFSPTNISGYPAYAWYPVNGQYGSFVLTNSSSTVNLNLVSVGSPSLVSGGINGLDYIDLDGTNDALYSATHKINSQPIEYVIVLAVTNIGSAKHFVTSTNTTERAVFYNKIGTEFNLYSGTAEVTSARTITNNWIVINAVFNGANSVIYTNGVAGQTGNPGTRGMQGLTIGASDTHTVSFSRFKFAELVTYATNLGSIDSQGTFTASPQRSNLFRYMTNKYAISP